MEVMGVQQPVMVEANRVDRISLFRLQQKFQVSRANNSLFKNLKLPVEHRFGKPMLQKHYAALVGNAESEAADRIEDTFRKLTSIP